MMVLYLNPDYSEEGLQVSRHHKACKRFSESEIINFLRAIEVKVSGGMTCA